VPLDLESATKSRLRQPANGACGTSLCD